MKETKNVTIPHELFAATIKLCMMCQFDEWFRDNCPEIKEQAEKVYKMLGEKMDRMICREDYIKNGGRFTREEIIKEIWESDPNNRA
jgi:hypothetical protein